MHKKLKLTQIRSLCPKKCSLQNKCKNSLFVCLFECVCVCMYVSLFVCVCVTMCVSVCMYIPRLCYSCPLVHTTSIFFILPPSFYSQSLLSFVEKSTSITNFENILLFISLVEHKILDTKIKVCHRFYELGLNC